MTGLSPASPTALWAAELGRPGILQLLGSRDVGPVCCDGLFGSDHFLESTPDHQIIQWLADVAPRFPREAVRCLELVAEVCDWGFHLSVWDSEANTILVAALRDPQAGSRQSAADLINRLGSRGHRQFRSLLQDQGPAQQ